MGQYKVYSALQDYVWDCTWTEHGSSEVAGLYEVPDALWSIPLWSLPCSSKVSGFSSFAPSSKDASGTCAFAIGAPSRHGSGNDNSCVLIVCGCHYCHLSSCNKTASI